MKPWEETWSALGRTVHMPEHFETRPPTVIVREVAPFPHAEQATLAAAAPELYRALAAVEWSGTIDGGLTCPTCEATGGGHHEPGCALNAALRKARGGT